ncbi:nucleoside-diphosphate kinase [Rhizobium sp. NLR4a]|uniref:nucleoside-diphosphate kinase n=2 Tax=Rhizobium/Agrobacterium group TaxID=227290 RepID=UPI001C83E17F|nr:MULTISPECIES: nucleoside-diphosphate kinase [Rhizobium]MBX4870304.1 nucleoside-diphosphate kinase [Rhizobium bangladeshense]MBX5213773.1 nucleoside-diphosphate kinase [Rhizobium sp. NLR9a]MBX5219076.1 nucleoside-diphosphate kinase [Rhizobium sp. NLR8a]MBX5232990.1 nucleoside-diphosphate kinase [Rhizobium sp. NLR4a]MBX5275162.1 nucleoside-diphosphate kinase [Rhizobium sp. NLR13a]
MSEIGLTVYGPEVGKSGLTACLDDFIRRETGLEITERFLSIHSCASITSFYSLTGSTGGKHWPIVLDLFDARPAFVTIWAGPNALERLRKIKGNTQPAHAAVGTVRSRFYCDNPVTNLIHVSDSPDIMELEIAILRRRLVGNDQEGWASLNSGSVSHSSLRVLLAVLGDHDSYDAHCVAGDDTAVKQALWALAHAETLSVGRALSATLQSYLAGEQNSVDTLIRSGDDVSAWDRLLLQSGLHAMCHWSSLRMQSSISLCGGAA